MKKITNKISRLLLIGLIIISACKETQKKDHLKKGIKKYETTINEKLLIGSWLDQSEAKLHFSLLKNGDAHSDNMKTLLYKKWKLEGRKLILVIKSIGNGSSSIDKETYEIKTLTENKMILQKGEYLSLFLKKN